MDAWTIGSKVVARIIKDLADEASGRPMEEVRRREVPDEAHSESTAPAPAPMDASGPAAAKGSNDKQQRPRQTHAYAHAHLERSDRPGMAHLERSDRPGMAHLERSDRPGTAHLERSDRPGTAHLERSDRPGMAVGPGIAMGAETFRRNTSGLQQTASDADRNDFGGSKRKTNGLLAPQLTTQTYVGPPAKRARMEDPTKKATLMSPMSADL